MDARCGETTIPVIYGRTPQAHEKEHSERMHYESGQGEADAATVDGR